jgi:hypothetical protein
VDDWGRASKGVFITRAVIVYFLVPFLLIGALSVSASVRPGVGTFTFAICLPLLVVAGWLAREALRMDRGFGWRDDVAVVATVAASVLVGLGMVG